MAEESKEIPAVDTVDGASDEGSNHEVHMEEETLEENPPQRLMITQMVSPEMK